MQAALLSVKLQYLNREIARRQEIAQLYTKGIKNEKVQLPCSAELAADQSESHVFHLYVVRTEQRDALARHLADNNIQTLIHYPIPPHQQQAYREWNQSSYPVSEMLHQQVLSLPMGPTMTNEQVNRVIEVVNSF